MIFPENGTATEVASWLRFNDFDDSIIQSFVKFNGNAMLGMNQQGIFLMVSGGEGVRLSSLLNNVRNLKGK